MIPAGAVCDEVATAMDVLPTLARLVGAALPTDRTLDGHDVTDLLVGRPDAKSLTGQFLYYTAKGELAGIRRGAWKLLLEAGELYDVEQDVSERWNVVDGHPALVAELRALALASDARITAEARPVRTVTELCFDPTKPTSR